MSWSKHDRKGRGYHHGNLREALIAAALDLIGEKGPAGFTFAEAARWAGVSPAAPYRHFRDRDALMADVALRGFERFAEALEKAWDEGRPHPYRAMENLGRAYLAFARNEPAYYAAMFEAQLPPDASRDLAKAGDRAAPSPGDVTSPARFQVHWRASTPVYPVSSSPECVGSRMA